MFRDYVRLSFFIVDALSFHFDKKFFPVHVKMNKSLILFCCLIWIWHFAFIVNHLQFLNVYFCVISSWLLCISKSFFSFLCISCHRFSDDMYICHLLHLEIGPLFILYHLRYWYWSLIEKLLQIIVSLSIFYCGVFGVYF